MALLLTSIAVLTTSQVPQALDFPASPAITAAGGAGAGRIGHPSALSLNPATLSFSEPLLFELSFFETRGIDESGFSMLAAFKGPLAARYGLSYRQKGIEDLIDDPTVNDRDPRVTDAVLRLAVARAVAGDRISLGISGTAGWSTVVATDGQTLFLDAGVAIRAHPLVALGASWRRIGSGYRWEEPDGSAFEASLAPGVRVGAALGRVTMGPVGVLAAGDVEWGKEMSGTDIALGVDASIAGLAFVRGGVARPAGADAIVTGGLGLMLKTLALDLAYESSNVVGPRFHIALTYRGVRQQPSAEEKN